MTCVTTEFANGAIVDATITGVFDDEALITADYLFDESVLRRRRRPDRLRMDRHLDRRRRRAGRRRRSHRRRVDEFPAADVETTQQFRDRAVGMIDDILAMVNIMVALAVVIALIGIANTLALSVFERTRELGLVRAVGMTTPPTPSHGPLRSSPRRHLRRRARRVDRAPVRLGRRPGTARPAFASTLAIPVQSIVMLMIVAATAGVLAAVLPARRAGRLNVLDAISH